MTLQEALESSSANQFIARLAWIEAGSSMKILCNSKVIDELQLALTGISFNADDWVVINKENSSEI